MSGPKCLLSHTCRLTELPPGACCEVADLPSGTHLDRLKSMGICLGRRLEVVKSGDPLIMRVYGLRIGLSARLAEEIRVVTCASSPRCWERIHGG